MCVRPFNPPVPGDSEALHDPASKERQRVRCSATKHDSANGETGSRRLHQHCEQGGRSSVVTTRLYKWSFYHLLLNNWSSVLEVRVRNVKMWVTASKSSRLSLTSRLCVSVVVSGDPSDGGLGSSDEESRWWPELWSSASPGNTHSWQTAAEEELPKSSSAAGEPQSQGGQFRLK